MKIEKILIYNSGGGLGDSIQIIPLILSLKNHYRRSKIFYLGAHPNHFEGKLKEYNINIDTLELNLSSEVSHLSPVVDLSRCDMITTANIINNIEPTDGIGGECAGNYITKVARLEKSATGLKVMLAANIWTESKIVVMYKLIPVGYADSLDELPFQFYNTTGRPDTGELIPNNDLVICQFQNFSGLE